MYDENLGGEVRLDQDLYVTRNAEQIVRSILSKQDHTANLILLVGEAGFGKTSLLWRLYDSSDGSAGSEPWFIKSTLLIPAPASEATRGAGHVAKVGTEFIVDAAKTLIAQGKRPLVLLDTVDL
jgi:GTPase SAR1 family protein